MWNIKKRIFVLILSFSITAIVFFAVVLVNPPDEKFHVSGQGVPICLNRVNIPLNEMHWIYVPESADELYTEENLFFLAGQLISNGVVDAGTCPSNGLALNGYANACGMSTAKPAVIAVQNLVNEPILQAWEDVGVLPVVLKQMIRAESQFWPSQNNIHYGYGHVTNIGIRNALEWNPDLRAKVCPVNPSENCVTSIPGADRILNSLIATCITCPYGIDLNKADRSVDILAEVVMGYCFQSSQLVFNATGWHSSMVVDYPTIWKLTLMNYNAGSECVFDAVAKAFKFTNGPVSWSDIKANVSGDQCIRGMTYANQITSRYYNFPP